MENLELYRSGRVVAEYPAPGQPLEIGRSIRCDITVDDPALANRHYLVAREGGTLRAYDVSSGRAGKGKHVPLDRMWPLGQDHALVRRYSEGAQRASPPVVQRETTAPLVRHRDGLTGLVLQSGRGTEARRYPLDSRPIQVGRGGQNDVVLRDEAVSGTHCRFEREYDGIAVRDLDSRNGTFVNGIRVQRARLFPGAGIRVGNTELRLLARSASGDLERADHWVAVSAPMMSVVADVRRLASLPWPVLIHGETGSGKEGVARELHRASARSTRPFVTLNAGGVSRDLVESELFGHERGAFTGAIGAHRGVFEQADGGTLFLDEIGELPLEAQARLLRTLDTGEVRRVGAETLRSVDTRLLCATHRDLRAMVVTGEFREDLFFRIARVLVEVPPLRARPEDVGPLTTHFLSEMATAVGQRHLSPAAMAQLLSYDWPGNVRELKNVLASAVACCSGVELDGQSIRDAVARVGRSRVPVSSRSMHQVVVEHRGNVTAAARALGMPRSTLRDRVKARARART